jgi:hypothetical protein
MPWERRNRKGSYFTLTICGPQKSRRRLYCGKGGSVGAELASTMVEIATLERRRKGAILVEEMARWRTLQMMLQHLWRGVDFLARASLISAGFYEHRGEWRRRRGKQTTGQERAR